MRKNRNYFKDLDLTTSCTACGYKIPPKEILRTGWDLIRCPKCSVEFEPEMKGQQLSSPR